MKVFKQAALVIILAVFATIALARSEGIYNPSSNAVGDYQGIDSNKASGAPAFTGPGDVTTWKVYWSLRAYSSATRGNKLANVCNSTGGVDVGCADMLSSATTGNLVSATISGITCPGANCTVKTLYDLSGQNFCGGSPCDVTQATVANRPTLTANCVNTSLPCMQFVNANSQILSTSVLAPATAQPYTTSWVANHNSTSGTHSVGLQGNVDHDYFSTNNEVFISAGVTLGPVAASDAAWHSLQAVFTTSPNSVISVDNVETTGNAGTGTILNSDALNFGARTNGAAFFDGKIVEFGFDTTVHNGAARTAMCHNQFQYWATATSC